MLFNEFVRNFEPRHNCKHRATFMLKEPTRAVWARDGTCDVPHVHAANSSQAVEAADTESERLYDSASLSYTEQEKQNVLIS